MQRPDVKSPTRAAGSPYETAAGLYAVSKLFDSLWGGNLVRALTNASFEVKRGEVFGLLGPAGSGKSTVLKILAGKLGVTEGKAAVFGRSPKSSALKTRVGYLPENQKASGDGAGKGLRDAFNHWLGFSTESARGVRNLMQALLNNPDLLLLDDPFTGLNEVALLETKLKIRSLATSGKTVIITSRSLAEATRLCDRIAILRSGGVTATGTIEELLQADDAINLVAPILPAAIGRRLAKVIGEELQREQSSLSIANLSATEASGKGLPAAGETSLPGKTDSIDHDRLAELAKPTLSATSESKPIS